MYHVCIVDNWLFKVLYYTGKNFSGFKVYKLKNASLQVYSRPLYKINSDYNTWALLSQKFYPFFFLFVLHSSALYNEISGLLLSFRTVDIVKEKRCAMLLLNY